MLNKKSLDADLDGQFGGLPLDRMNHSSSQNLWNCNYAEADIIRLSAFFRDHPIPILVFNPEGEVIKTNPAAERLLNRLHIEQAHLLPAEHLQVVQAALEGRLREYVVEVKVNGCILALTYQAVAAFKLVYLYAIEITDYHKSEEEFLRMANHTLDMVKIAILQLHNIRRSLPRRKSWRRLLLGTELNHPSETADLFVSMDGCVFSATAGTTDARYD